MITGGTLARAARGANPACFAMTMATGIVSAAVRQDGLPRLSVALLAVAAGSFVILAVTSCWRAGRIRLACAPT